MPEDLSEAQGLGALERRKCCAIFRIRYRDSEYDNLRGLVNDQVSEYANIYSDTASAEGGWLTRKRSGNGRKGPPDLKAELKRAEMTYDDLADKLKKHGFKETKASIASKLSRATMSAHFFLAALAAMGKENVSLEDIWARSGVLSCIAYLILCSASYSRRRLASSFFCLLRTPKRTIRYAKIINIAAKKVAPPTTFFMSSSGTRDIGSTLRPLLLPQSQLVSSRDTHSP